LFNHYKLNLVDVINLNYLLLSLRTDKEVPVGASHLSDIFGAEYNKRFPPRSSPGTDGPENEDSDPTYFYPRAQYKIIRGAPIIAAVGEGCELLWEIYGRLDEINNGQREWKIVEKRLIDRTANFGISQKFFKYRFLTPWLALPEELLKRFLLADAGGRQKMLTKILERNFRSIAESLGYEIKDELRIKVNVKANFIFQKDVHFAGLFGTFMANFDMPNFLGIGKSVSRGFGTIKQNG